NIGNLHKEGIVWISGKVPTDRTVNVPYLGGPLKPFKKYYWNVVVYDQNDKPSSGAVGSFETAMFDEGDWRAKWISDGSANPANDADFFKEDRMPLFRKE